MSGGFYRCHAQRVAERCAGVSFFVLAAGLLAGCGALIVMPGDDAVCRVQLKPLTMPERNAVAGEIGQLTAQKPDAVTPGWVKDYLALRANVRQACADARAGT